MERTRQWIQTLALAAIGAAALVVAVGTVLPARAAEPATCTTLSTERLSFPKAGEELGAQAAPMLGGHEHAIVIPVGTMGATTGHTYTLLCVW